jgi:hypothetical protein
MRVRRDFEHHLLTLLTHRPVIHLPSVKRLLGLCEQQMQSESHSGWLTFWSLAAHYFTGLQQDPGREFTVAEAAAASQVLSGLLLREQFNPEQTPSDLNLQVVNHLLFLDQADVITQRLVNTLQVCATEPEPALLENLQEDARRMAMLAQDVSLAAVQQVADALASQLARLRAQRVVVDLSVSLQGAQEVSRLLHQFAVGNAHVPQENVLAALRSD